MIKYLALPLIIVGCTAPVTDPPAHACSPRLDGKPTYCPDERDLILLPREEVKGEIDIRFIKEMNHQKIALPSSSKVEGIRYHDWSNNQLKIDSNKIPSPVGEKALNPTDISILFVPAIAIDQSRYRLGYGGGYFDRLRQKDLWVSIPTFVVISNNCISRKPLPRDKWDLPFSGWISEKGLHQIQATK